MLLDAMTAAGLRTVADLRDGLTEEQLALVRRAAAWPSAALVKALTAAMRAAPGEPSGAKAA